MFRLSGLPQIDAAEEKRRVREGVKTNVFSFIVLCAAIRIGRQFSLFYLLCIRCNSTVTEVRSFECFGYLRLDSI